MQVTTHEGGPKILFLSTESIIQTYRRKGRRFTLPLPLPPPNRAYDSRPIPSVEFFWSDNDYLAENCW